MKKLILPLFALITYVSHAQFSIVPQVGVESFRTTIKAGNFASFSPLGQQFAPGMGVRMAYSFKQQGVFFGVASSTPAVNFRFSDPENSQTSYTASGKNLQLRLEAGYQLSSKPITLRKSAYKSGYSGKSEQKSAAAKQGGCTHHICGGMKRSASDYNRTASPKKTHDNGLYMRIKPSVGFAIVPTGGNMKTETNGGETVYSYGAGLHTALIAGTAFEFGSRNQPKLIVSINYLQGLGNNTQTITKSEALKTTVTNLSSKTSGFNINVGIPFTFKKKTAAIENRPSITPPSRYGRCGRSRVYQL